MADIEINTDEIELRFDLSQLEYRARHIGFIYPDIIEEEYKKELFDFGIFQRRPDLIPDNYPSPPIRIFGFEGYNEDSDNIYKYLRYKGYTHTVAREAERELSSYMGGADIIKTCV